MEASIYWVWGWAKRTPHHRHKKDAVFLCRWENYPILYGKAVKVYMVKFEEAAVRKLRNIFVCRSCKSKIRAPSLKVAQKKIKCRKCNSKHLRPKRKK